MTRKIVLKLSFFFKFQPAKALNVLRSLELQILLAKKKLVYAQIYVCVCVILVHKFINFVCLCD